MCGIEPDDINIIGSSKPSGGDNLMQFDVQPKEDNPTHTFEGGDRGFLQERREKYFLLNIPGYIVHVDYGSFMDHKL